ncbi:MAG TPA: phosphotransferase, partial [Dehalococcoidia bacterium]|nr:phosphotransferase [Dehalococcoidia bacterium]
KEMDWLQLYHGLLLEGGVAGYSFDQCLEDYRWTAMFCFAYPVMGGGLGDVANDRALALGRAMTERSITAILDWKAHELLA